MAHRPESDTADLFRRVFRELDELRNGPKRVGDWVISQNTDGDLIITAPGRRTVVLSDQPEQVTIVQEVAAEEET